MADNLLPTSLGDVTPYENRWVAVVRGRVVGVGLNRQQAYRAAKQIRPKDKPTLLFINAQGQPETTDDRLPVMMMEHPWLEQHKLLRETVQALQALQVEAYLVGGAVRDFMLGRNDTYDLDFAVPGDGVQIARKIANALR